MQFQGIQRYENNLPRSQLWMIFPSFHLLHWAKVGVDNLSKPLSTQPQLSYNLLLLHQQISPHSSRISRLLFPDLFPLTQHWEAPLSSIQPMWQLGLFTVQMFQFTMFPLFHILSWYLERGCKQASSMPSLPPPELQASCCKVYKILNKHTNQTTTPPKTSFLVLLYLFIVFSKSFAEHLKCKLSRNGNDSLFVNESSRRGSWSVVQVYRHYSNTNRNAKHRAYISNT